ncbi:MAG: peptide chain release factor N(5)-glutamine methyltransferase [Ferruginibacter sp.]
MTVQKLYRHFLATVKQIYSANEASKITDMIFEWAAAISKSDILLYPDNQLNSSTIQQLDNALIKLLQHIPVQYIIGEGWFYKMNLKVSPAVLIPRPETEELVLEILNHLKKSNEQSTVLDIGTGSGCIAIAIKKNATQTNVSAIDVSEQALQIAEENAKAQQVTVSYLQLDFLNEKAWKDLPAYDIIVSNPPYIPLNEKELMDKNVTTHEPHTALFVPAESPLIFYEKIALFGKSHLNKNGKIFMETHEDFAGKVATLFEQSGYKTAIKKDMFDKERMVMATRFP